MNRFPPIMVLRVLTYINPMALLKGNVWHELFNSALLQRRIVLSGKKSVIAVGARCTDVRADKLLVVRGCCARYVE